MGAVSDFFDSLVGIWNLCFGFFPGWFAAQLLGLFATFVIFWGIRLILTLLDIF